MNKETITIKREIPMRVVKSRKPSPVSKSGISSTFVDSALEEHAETLRKFITKINEK